jgi:hypothetical protein
MPAQGYAYAIYPRMIVQSLKRGIFLNAQDNKFVQCVSPSSVTPRHKRALMVSDWGLAKSHQ